MANISAMSTMRAAKKKNSAAYRDKIKD